MRLVRTAAAALFGVCLGAAIGVASFGVQAVALPRATRADLVAADALRQLLRYPSMSSVERINRRVIDVVCRQVWHRNFDSTVKHRRAVVIRSDGWKLFDQAGAVWPSGPPQPLVVQDAQFALAGCPRILTMKIARRLERREGLIVQNDRVDGRLAAELSFTAVGARFEYYASSTGYIPLAIHVVAPGLNAWSDLREQRGREDV